MPFNQTTHDYWVSHPEAIAFITQWYPHWGAPLVAKELNLPMNLVSNKAKKLNLGIMPQAQRLCYNCRIKFQTNSHAGYLCWECFKIKRKSVKKSFQAAFDPLTRKLRNCRSAANNRNSGKFKAPQRITLKQLRELYDKQNGRCYYTGRVMNLETHSWHRDDDLTVDRLNSKKPYSNDNIVLSTWWANCAKGLLSVDEFRQRCKLVAVGGIEPPTSGL